jgi:hypothetical protein
MLFVVARAMQSPPCVVAHGHTSNDKAAQLLGTAPASTQHAKHLDD